MKRMNLILCLLIAGVAVDHVASGSEPIRVGILAARPAENLAAVLNEQTDINADIISRPNPGMFSDLDVLVVTQQRIPALLARQIPNIVSWVNDGGGAILLHDAVGYRQHIPMFPLIGMGTGHPRLNEGRIAKEHPVTHGLEVGQVFQHSFQHDHISIEPGEDGIPLVVNERDEPFLVAGKAGQGRVVLNGMLTGNWGTPEMGSSEIREGYPKGAERTLFINAIRWLGGRD